MSNSAPRKRGQPDFGSNGMKSEQTAVEARFAEAQSRLGPHRQQLIRAIVDQCEETCFLSSRELAKRYRVDAATVVRAVQAMGYKRFADFIRDLRQHLMSRITPYTVLKTATSAPLVPFQLLSETKRPGCKTARVRVVVAKYDRRDFTAPR